MNSREKLTLVLGASLNKSRYSNICINTLVDAEIPARAIGLREGEVAGVQIETGQPEIEGLHTVTLYLNPRNQVPYYEYIIRLKPKRIIFNPGTWNPDLADLAKDNDIQVVSNCTLIMISGKYY
jgi:predicted CoA-binding protein